MNPEKKKDEEKDTPIIDGDARPDNQLGPEDRTSRKNVIIKKDADPVTRERGADVNSLEDYKDAKTS